MAFAKTILFVVVSQIHSKNIKFLFTLDFRKILLFLDNAPVHPVDLKLSNITMIFFPPNTTSKVQPLDQGIIRAFKVYYRSRLVKHVISSCTLASSLDQVVITALDAIYWIDAAWKNVTESTVRNTFRTAGFKHYHLSDAVEDAEEEISEVIDNEPIKKLDILLSHLQINGPQLSATQYMMVDDDIPVFNEWEDNPEILQVTENIEQDQEQNQNEDEFIPEEPPSLVDALEMIRKLLLLVSIRQPELHQLVSELESKLADTYIDSKSSKQSSITDFFFKSLIVNKEINLLVQIKKRLLCIEIRIKNNLYNLTTHQRQFPTGLCVYQGAKQPSVAYEDEPL